MVYESWYHGTLAYSVGLYLCFKHYGVLATSCRFACAYENSLLDLAMRFNLRESRSCYVRIGLSTDPDSMPSFQAMQLREEFQYSVISAQCAPFPRRNLIC